MNNTANNIVAGGAVASPVWLPWLQSGSEIAALLLPIAGLAWLLIQIGGYILKQRKAHRDRKVDN